jgi:hypothetical protein
LISIQKIFVWSHIHQSAFQAVRKIKQNSKPQIQKFPKKSLNAKELEKYSNNLKGAIGTFTTGISGTPLYVPKSPNSTDLTLSQPISLSQISSSKDSFNFVAPVSASQPIVIQSDGTSTIISSNSIDDLTIDLSFSQKQTTNGIFESTEEEKKEKKVVQIPNQKKRKIDNSSSHLIGPFKKKTSKINQFQKNEETLWFIEIKDWKDVKVGEASKLIGSLLKILGEGASTFESGSLQGTTIAFPEEIPMNSLQNAKNILNSANLEFSIFSPNKSIVN